jgi:CubicO group peptidase (beta-lactamase class C family)
MCTNRVLFLTKQALIILLLLALFGSLTSIPLLAQSDIADPIIRIDNIFTNAAERDAFSGSVLIAKEGSILLEKGYGYAIREWDVPNTADTKFLIGSITKQFTAMAILILHERGTLTVDDAICIYFDDCPETWSNVTIHHLLTHTGGIPEYIGSPAFNENLTHNVGIDEIIGWFRDQPLDFAPGENWSYSNSGYVLLGEVIREVSGESYQTFLRENIFEPVGLSNTGYASNTRVIDHMASGYADSYLRADYINYSIPYSAGALYSTVGDLNRWNQALHNGQVISQATWDMMLARAFTFPDGSGSKYAYGLNFSSIGEHPVIGHGGGINGFVSINLYFPEQEISVIILENIEEDPGMLLEITTNILLEQ